MEPRGERGGREEERERIRVSNRRFCQGGEENNNNNIVVAAAA